MQWYPDQVKACFRRVTLKRTHAFLGTATYALSMTVVFLALFSTYFLNNVMSEEVWYLCAVCPVTLLLNVMLQFFYNYIKTLF